MALRHGRNARIYLNGVDISGDLNTVSPTSEQDLGDISVFGHIGHSFYPGLAKDVATIDGLYNSTERTVIEAMVQLSTSYAMMIGFGQTRGDPAYAANEVALKSNSIKSVVTDVNRVSVNLEASKYPFEPGVLLTAGIQTVAAASTGQGTQVDHGSASGTTGGAAYLQVFSVVTPGTLTVSLQTSSTGAWAGEQATSATFAAASTNGTERVALSSQLNRYARAAWVNTASTASFALSLTRY